MTRKKKGKDDLPDTFSSILGKTNKHNKIIFAAEKLTTEEDIISKEPVKVPSKKPVKVPSKKPGIIIIKCIPALIGLGFIYLSIFITPPLFLIDLLAILWRIVFFLLGLICIISTYILEIGEAKAEDLPRPLISFIDRLCGFWLLLVGIGISIFFILWIYGFWFTQEIDAVVIFWSSGIAVGGILTLWGACCFIGGRSGFKWIGYLSPLILRLSGLALMLIGIGIIINPILIVAYWIGGIWDMTSSIGLYVLLIYLVIIFFGGLATLYGACGLIGGKRGFAWFIRIYKSFQSWIKEHFHR